MIRPVHKSAVETGTARTVGARGGAGSGGAEVAEAADVALASFGST